MEERVRAEGGTLTIQTKPGAGTAVTAFVPLDEAWLKNPDLEIAELKNMEPEKIPE